MDCAQMKRFSTPRMASSGTLRGCPSDTGPLPFTHGENKCSEDHLPACVPGTECLGEDAPLVTCDVGTQGLDLEIQKTPSWVTIGSTTSLDSQICLDCPTSVYFLLDHSPPRGFTRVHGWMGSWSGSSRQQKRVLLLPGQDPIAGGDWPITTHLCPFRLRFPASMGISGCPYIPAAVLAQMG